MLVAIDPVQAISLGADFRSIAERTDRITDDLIRLQVASLLSTGAVSMLDDVDDQLRVNARELERSAVIADRFRLPLRVQTGRTPTVGRIGTQPVPSRGSRPLHDVIVEPNQTEQLQAIIDRIRRSTADGRAPDPRDFAAVADGLREQMDDVAADRAFGLALRGVPLEIAEGLIDDAALDDYFAQLATALGDGDSDTFQLLFDGDAGIDPNTARDPLTSGVEVAELLGAASAASLSRFLATQSLVDEQADAAQLLADEADVGFEFLQALGAEGLLDLMHNWAVGDPLAFAESLPLLSATLALASHDPTLGFTGDELIEADATLIGHIVTAQNVDINPAAHAEMLLLAPDFDAAFLLAAAVSSLGRASDGFADSFGADLAVDRRLTTMASLLANDLARAHIESLSPEAIADLLNPPSNSVLGDGDDTRPYGSEHPWLGDDVLIDFVLEIGEDRALTTAVIAALAAHPDESGAITDLRVELGLDVVLAGHAVGWPLDGFEAEDFLAVYEQLLAAGGGELIYLASFGPMTATLTTTALLGDLASDITFHRSELVSQIFGNYHASGLGETLADVMASNEKSKKIKLFTTLISLTPVTGTAGSAFKALKLGYKLYGISAQTPVDPMWAQLATVGIEAFEAPDLAKLSVIHGALATGLVQDEYGVGITVEHIQVMHVNPLRPETVIITLDNRHLNQFEIDGETFGDWATSRATELVNGAGTIIVPVFEQFVTSDSD